MYCSHCGSPNPDDAKFCAHCGAALQTAGAAAVPPTIAKPVAKTVEYAGFWRRFIAYIVDRFIIGIPFSIIIIAFLVPSIIAICSSPPDPDQIPFAVISFVLGWLWLIALVLIAHLLYFTFFESSKLQATPGKMLIGIIVTDLQGQRISFLRALGRNLGKVLSHMLLNIGFIMAGFTARKQALHDILAETLVVMK